MFKIQKNWNGSKVQNKFSIFGNVFLIFQEVLSFADALVI